MTFRPVILTVMLLLGACNSSAIKDAIDLIDGVPEKDIDTSMMGVNSFGSDARFGTTAQQMTEVKDVLRLNSVRVLFNWSNEVQGSPTSSQNFSFYDDVLDAIPAGVDALVVIAGLPDWMSVSANWIEGNPRTTFVERWVKPVAQRYGSNPKVLGFEIWNEPNMVANPQNLILNVSESPSNYVELLARASNVVRESAPGKKVLNAATTAINQNYPESLDYNRAMRDAGAQAFVDVWAVHYYGKQFENVVRSGGVADFLNGMTKPIWVTESGAQGVSKQLGYVRQAWPFLIDNISGIQRFYYYQFAEATPAASTYGLKNLDSGASISDLYIFLRDRPIE